jgi:hypothetical protein
VRRGRYAEVRQLGPGRWQERQDREVRAANRLGHALVLPDRAARRGQVDSGCNAANLSHRAEENQLSTRCTGNDPTCNSGTEAIPAADLDNLIAPFSYAKWKSQAAHAEPDLRNGAALEAVENLKPSATTINEGTDPDQPHFVGTRYVYNILTQNEPTYAASASYLGINQNTLANGFLCQDNPAKASVASHKKVASMLKSFGFTPLPDAVQGAGQPSGYCRFDATPV